MLPEREMGASLTEIPIFDGHNDALTAANQDLLVTGGGDGQLDLPRMREANVRGAMFAVFVQSRDEHHDLSPQPGVPYAQPLPPKVQHTRAAGVAAKAAGRLLALERQSAVRVARSVADIDAAATGEGPPAVVLHFEGAEAVDPQLESLETWYAAGLRSLGPVWSRANAFGQGVPFAFPSSPDTGPGLTKAGTALVRRCADLGIAVDLSHLNEAGFWDVARLDAGPLIVSHAGVHALSGCSRNLTDAQIDAVASSGGLIGIVFATYFLRADFADEPETTPLGAIVEHVRYVADRVGVDHVAFGSDFDGATIPTELGDVAGYPKLLEALRSAGFSPPEIRAIAWDNWRRVLDASWR